MAKKTKKLSSDQLKGMLEAKIRARARWRIKDAVEEGDPGSLVGDAAQISVNPKKLKVVASRIYDDMMADLSWTSSDDRVLEAMNSVKGGFSVGYVQRVIRQALKDEVLKLESATVDGIIADTVNEKCKSLVHKKRKKKE